jgi:uncharacterized surface protein with fasciclin (FAS1) repeats
MGVSIMAAGLFASLSSQAQTGVPTAVPTAVPSTMPTTPGGMTKPVTTPSATPSGMTKPTTTPATVAPAGKTIAQLVTGDKNFTTLLAALKAAELTDTLASEGPFTVFAPTNDAFKKIPKATLAKLLKPENKEQLKKLLTYHVVSGAVTSKMLKSGQQVDTVEGGKVTITIKGKKVMVNKATVLLADVKASNGVIHAIDTVLIPGK